jgi:hypothetical protein
LFFFRPDDKIRVVTEQALPEGSESNELRSEKSTVLF